MKPDEQMYHRLLEEWKLPQGAVWMVGDNEKTDVEGPRAVGMNAVLLDRTGASSRPDKIGSLQDLIPYINRSQSCSHSDEKTS